MVKQVLSYVTDDGKHWDTLEEAEAYEQYLKTKSELSRWLLLPDTSVPSEDVTWTEMVDWLMENRGTLMVLLAGGTVEQATVD